MHDRGTDQEEAFAPVVPGCLLSCDICSDDVSILVAEHRVLIIAINAPRCQILVASIHGLDFAHAEAAVVAFGAAWLS